MKTTRSLMMIAILLGNAALARAQDARSSTQGSTSSGATADANRATAEASAQATSEAEAAVRQKAVAISAKSTASADTKLESSLHRIDQSAARDQQNFEARMARELGITVDALIAEKNELRCSWGTLIIADALEANAKTTLTVEDIVALRTEGLGWGQIAAGMGLKVGDVVSALRAESQVAMGTRAADGRLEVIHGPGAKAGMDVGAAVGIGAGHAVGANIGMGAHAAAGLPGLPIKP